MYRRNKVRLNSFKKVLISGLLIGATFFAFASIGGDKNSAKKNSLTANFLPLRTSRGYTIKAGPNYHGSMILKEERSAGSISYNSLITYQKGNSTYILPNKYKVPLSSAARTNLQLINLRFRLCK